MVGLIPDLPLSGNAPSGGAIMAFQVDPPLSAPPALLLTS